jgi:predicted ATPase
MAFIAEMAEALCPGQVSGGVATIEEAIDRAERTGDGWIVAELWRLKGELLRFDGSPGTMHAAEDCFRHAVQLAKTQDAMFWELRAAMSLAALHRAWDRTAEAVACLRPVYDRFTEGFGTADLLAAKRLLDELSVA